MKHTIEELHAMQKLPLAEKINLTMERVQAWVEEYGENGVYLSFSGGKDSTVLIDVIRERMGYTKIHAVFVDVPTQYPELKEFVQTFDNVTIIRPKISFREVCEKYGFPLISKEVSECVWGARKYLRSIEKDLTQDAEQRTLDGTERNGTERKPYAYWYDKVCGFGKYQKSDGGGTITSIANSEELAHILNERMHNKQGGNNQRLAIMLGMLTKDQKIKANIPSKDRSAYSQEKYKFFLESRFNISNQCCNIMKKYPAHDYFKKTGRRPITAQMADESRLRTQKWLEHGCNGFDLKIPTCNPMAFWLEQDVLRYIKQYDLPICCVYGDVVTDDESTGQMNLEGMLDGFEMGEVKLKTTGCDRTGCVLCGFGCHLEKPGEGRFVKLKQSHPGLYSLLDKIKNNGVTYREAIEWTNQHLKRGHIEL